MVLVDERSGRLPRLARKPQAVDPQAAARFLRDGDEGDDDPQHDEAPRQDGRPDHRQGARAGQEEDRESGQEGQRQEGPGRRDGDGVERGAGHRFRDGRRHRRGRVESVEVVREPRRADEGDHVLRQRHELQRSGAERQGESQDDRPLFAPAADGAEREKPHRRAEDEQGRVRPRVLGAERQGAPGEQERRRRRKPPQPVALHGSAGRAPVAARMPFTYVDQVSARPSPSSSDSARTIAPSS